MTDEALICPDCGGVIGATDPDVKHCTCAPITPKSARADEPENAPPIEPERPAPVKKICRICGKDLAGHRRLKDSLGYICVPCANGEAEAQEAGLVPCGECGRKLKPAGLIDYHGTKICRKCFADHQELSKFKAPPPDLTQHKQHEKESLKTLLIIGAILLLIILLATFKIIT